MAMKGEVEVTDYFEAILFAYEGVPCTKVVSTQSASGPGRINTYTFVCPEHDATAIKEDFANQELAINMAAWINSTKHIDTLTVRARKAYGVWTSEAYCKARASEG
jgi:hypothetical protein